MVKGPKDKRTLKILRHFEAFVLVRRQRAYAPRARAYPGDNSISDAP
jgi:hypothetical protein